MSEEEFMNRINRIYNNWAKSMSARFEFGESG